MPERSTDTRRRTYFRLQREYSRHRLYGMYEETDEESSCPHPSSFLAPCTPSSLPCPSQRFHPVYFGYHLCVWLKHKECGSEIGTRALCTCRVIHRINTPFFSLSQYSWRSFSHQSCGWSSLPLPTQRARAVLACPICPHTRGPLFRRGLWSKSQSCK